MLVFPVTPCLVVVVQSCVKWVPIKKKRQRAVVLGSRPFPNIVKCRGHQWDLQIIWKNWIQQVVTFWQIFGLTYKSLKFWRQFFYIFNVWFMFKKMGWISQLENVAIHIWAYFFMFTMTELFKNVFLCFMFRIHIL